MPPPSTPAWLGDLPFIGHWFRDGVPPDPETGRVAPHYALETDAPEPVASQIQEFTLLGRWRQRADYDPSQLALFMRRADEEVRSLLAAEGWFSAEVTVSAIPSGVRIAVVPGPRTRVREVHIEFDAEPAGPFEALLREEAVRGWLLEEGEPFRAEGWERAKRALLERLQEAGLLRAQILEAEAVVIRDAAQAALSLRVATGPRLGFGPVQVGGLQRYPVTVVEGLAPFRRGEPYLARRILDYQSLLNGAGWFATVNVRPDLQALEADPETEEVPIRVDVVERRARRWTLGGGFDTDRGVNLLAAWENRNVAGAGIQTFNGIELDLQRQLAYSTWETPQDSLGWRWQVGARLEHRDVSNDLVDAGSLFVARARRERDIESSVSLQYQVERQNVVFGPGDEATYHNRAWVLGTSWTQRRLDSPIYPTQGYLLSGQLSGAAQALGSLTSFVRAYGFGYAILPLAEKPDAMTGRLVVRGELGAVAADRREGIPSANLFRTGGTRSVRGYAAQTLGVSLGEATVGGRYLFTSSVEYQHPIDPDLAAAVFYDWGNAADSLAALNPVAGYGLGVRWRTPVGPLHFDLAWGQAIHDWRLHVTIGVVF